MRVQQYILNLLKRQYLFSIDKNCSVQKILTKYPTILEKAQKALYEVEYLIAKNIKVYQRITCQLAALAIHIMNGDKVRK